MEWDYVRVTIQWSAPALSLAFLGMGVVRYFSDGLSDQCKISVRRSFAAYVVYPVPLLIALVSGHFLDNAHSPTHPLQGVIFLAMMLLSTGLLLLANVYYGFRSGVAAGRRGAMAGLSIIVAVFAGDLYFLNFLMGKAVV